VCIFCFRHISIVTDHWSYFSFYSSFLFHSVDYWLSLGWGTWQSVFQHFVENFDNTTNDTSALLCEWFCTSCALLSLWSCSSYLHTLHFTNSSLCGYVNILPSSSPSSP
jgi:hypothetical protein